MLILICCLLFILNTIKYFYIKKAIEKSIYRPIENNEIEDMMEIDDIRDFH